MKTYEIAYICNCTEALPSWPWDLNNPTPREAGALKALLMALNHDQVIPVEVDVPESEKGVNDCFETIDGFLIRRRMQYDSLTSGVRISFWAAQSRD